MVNTNLMISLKDFVNLTFANPKHWRKNLTILVENTIRNTMVFDNTTDYIF